MSPILQLCPLPGRLEFLHGQKQPQKPSCAPWMYAIFPGWAGDQLWVGPCTSPSSMVGWQLDTQEPHPPGVRTRGAEQWCTWQKARISPESGLIHSTSPRPPSKKDCFYLNFSWSNLYSSFHKFGLCSQRNQYLNKHVITVISHETTQTFGNARDPTCLFDASAHPKQKHVEILYFDFTCPDQSELISQDTQFSFSKKQTQKPKKKTPQNQHELWVYHWDKINYRSYTQVAIGTLYSEGV